MTIKNRRALSFETDHIPFIKKSGQDYSFNPTLPPFTNDFIYLDNPIHSVT